MASKKELEQMITWLKSIASDKDSFDGINAQRCLDYIKFLRGALDVKGAMIAGFKTNLKNAVIFKGSDLRCGRFIRKYSYNGYNVEIMYSSDDKEYYGKIVGIQDLVLFNVASTKKKQIEKTIKDVVDEYVNLKKGQLKGMECRQMTFDDF